MNSKPEAYLYLITITFLDGLIKYYLGWHKLDRGLYDDGYLHSSKDKELIKDFTNPDNEVTRKIIAEGTEEDMAYMEYSRLQKADAIRNPLWYNKSHGGGVNLKKHGNIKMIDELWEDIKAKKYLQDTQRDMDDILKCRRWQTRLTPLIPSHVQVINDKIVALNYNMSTWEPIIFLKDFDGPGEDLLYQGCHTTAAAEKTKRVGSIPQQLIPKKVWSKLSEMELKTLCKRLNPQIEKPSEPTSPDEAAQWMADNWEKNGVSVEAESNFVELEKWGFERYTIKRSLIPKAEKLIAKLRAIPSDHIQIDYRFGADKKHLDGLVADAKRGKTHSMAFSSSWFKMDEVLAFLLRNKKKKQKDRMNFIKFYIHHTDAINKSKWQKEYGAKIHEELTELNDYAKEEYAVEFDIEELAFTRPNPIKI